MNKDFLYRSATIEGQKNIDVENRTVELSFSSETPVERAFGNEILDHSPESVDLSRVDDGAPLLLEHDRTQQIGVIDRAWIDEKERKGRAIVRFSESALGSEVWTDIVQGIRSKVSVGYLVNNFVREKSDTGRETLRADQWSPIEVSVVSLPSDESVGVGRASEIIPAPQPNKEIIMDENPIQEEVREEVVERSQEAQPQVRVEVRPDKRATDIASLGEKYEAKDEAVRYISEGRSLDEFKNYLMERNASQPIEAQSNQDELGMSNKERDRYSLSRAILQSAEGRLDGIEREASEALEKKFGRAAQGFFLPQDVMQRDLTATGGDTGDKLIATEKPEMIEALRAQPIVAQLGARVLEGLSGNVTLPKAGVTTAAFTAENTAVSESTPTIGSISLSPKRVAAYSEVSKQLLQQANFDVENMLKSDLDYQLNLKWDAVAVDGGGSNEPSGILDNADLNAVSMAGASPTYAEVVEAEQKVMEDNALGGSLAYITTPAFMASLKTTEKSSSTGQYIWQDNQINGYRAIASNQVTAAHVVFGDFSQVILARFGALDIVSDPYSLALTGMIRLHYSFFCDVGIRHGQAFCKIA